MRSLWQDIRYGLRQMARNPGFTVAVVLCLALGIGANTAIFSVVNAVLLRPLPFDEPDRLVWVWQSYPGYGDRVTPSGPDFEDYKQRNRTFADMAAIGSRSLILTGHAHPELLSGGFVTPNFFRVLGVNPVVGRDFPQVGEDFGGDQVVILSHALWQRRFGLDGSVIGETVLLDGAAHTVIGVLPPDIGFFDKLEVFVPIRLDTRRGHRWLTVVGRLKDGITIRAAQADMDDVVAQLNREVSQGTLPVKLVALSSQLDENKKVGSALLTLQAAVAFILLIVCANIANLLLARNVARQREIALRAAVGAGRVRILQHLLTESVALSLLAGVIGVLSAFWWLDILLALCSPEVPDLGKSQIDSSVLLFALGLSVLTAMLFGLGPALRSSKADPIGALKEGGRSSSLGTGERRLLSLLHVFQIAMAVVLLSGAALMLNTLWHLSQVRPGFNPKHLLVGKIRLPKQRYRTSEQKAAFLREVGERVDRLPEVRGLGYADVLPMTGIRGCSFRAEGEGRAVSYYSPLAQVRVISPNYFQVMEVPLLKGRTFSDTDANRDRPAVIINETLARTFWPEEDPVGRRVSFNIYAVGNKLYEIIGVVADMKGGGLGHEAEPTLFVPYALAPSLNVWLVVRTAGQPVEIADDLRREIREIDPDVPVMSTQPMQHIIAETISVQRVTAVLLCVFGSVGLVVAASGVYGSSSRHVSRRIQEIGVRMALGARPSDILILMLRQGLVVSAIGLGTGLAGAFALTRYLRSMLYEVSPADPASFLGAGFLLSAVAMLACYIPARRGTRMAPMEALRYQ